MQDIDQLVAEIAARAQKLGFSIQGVARLSGLGKNTLRDMKKPFWSPTTTTLRALQKTILHLEGLNQDDLTKLAEDKKIHPPKFTEQDIETGTSTKKLTMTEKAPTGTSRKTHPKHQQPIKTA